MDDLEEEDIILETDVQRVVSNTDNHWFSPLAFALAKKNRQSIKEVEAYLKQESKEQPE